MSNKKKRKGSQLSKGSLIGGYYVPAEEAAEHLKNRELEGCNCNPIYESFIDPEHGLSIATLHDSWCERLKKLKAEK